jgi:hypothetical protein
MEAIQAKWVASDLLLPQDFPQDPVEAEGTGQKKIDSRDGRRWFVNL